MRWKTQTYCGWGRVLHADGDIARPERISSLQGLPATPAIGARRSYGDACLNSDGRAIDMTRLDRILSFDAETGQIEAEAGMQIGELARLFAPRGWIPAVMPGTGFATLGGCIAMDVHGANHHRDGSFGAHVTAIRMIHRGVPRRITPDGDGELFRATLGGLGQTGLILSATLRLAPCAGPSMAVRESRAADWDDHVARLATSDAPYALGWVDATARGPALGRGIIEEASHSTAPAPKPRRTEALRRSLPGLALAKPLLRGFDARRFTRLPASGRTRLCSIPDFFFPLDRIHNWNHLYGKRGFHQFQCVVPDHGLDALRAILARIATSELAAPRAMLIRMGPDRAGLMSFPMRGYSLAVDFPNRDPVPSLIRSLGDIAARAGGRIYLAKDALADGAQIRGMYPDRAAWATLADESDPDHLLETDMIRRLTLRAP